MKEEDIIQQLFRGQTSSFLRCRFRLFAVNKFLNEIVGQFSLGLDHTATHPDIIYRAKGGVIEADGEHHADGKSVDSRLEGANL
jgi:hypothetical protein